MSTTADPPYRTPPGGQSGVDPQAIVDVIESVAQVDEPVHSAGITADGFTLPGFGEPYDDCGDDILHFCENCGRDIYPGRTCRRSVCERCAQTWCRQRSTEIAARLESLRRQWAAERDAHQRFHHLVFSPPWADWKPAADDPFKRTMQVVKDILDVYGLEGVPFAHLWAGDSDTGGDDVGAWSDRLFSGRSRADVMAELTLRPHVHVIALGHRVPVVNVTDTVYDETGWVIHRITKGNTDVSMYGVTDLARVTTYDLSHTALRETPDGNMSAQYRYWGSDLNDIHVFDDVRRFVDEKVRAISTRTLGIPYQDVSCVADNRVNEDTHGHVSRVNLSDNADDSPGAEAEAALEADRDDVPGGGRSAPIGTNSRRGWDLDSYAAARGAASSDEFRLADGIPSRDARSTAASRAPARNRPPEEAPGPWPEEPKCRGRVLMGTKAPDYLGDPEWRARAPYADDLQEAYDEACAEHDIFPDPDENPLGDDPDEHDGGKPPPE